MKNVILILITVLSLYGISNGAGRAVPDIALETVYEGTFVLDTSEADTVVSKMFVPYADSLSFVAEIISADSLDADGALVSIDARIRFVTVTGIADTTAYANLTKVIDKTAAAGNAYFGDIVALPSSYKGSRAKLEINLVNTNDGAQTVKIRIYAIKEWR